MRRIRFRVASSLAKANFAKGVGVFDLNGWHGNRWIGVCTGCIQHQSGGRVTHVLEIGLSGSKCASCRGSGRRRALHPLSSHSCSSSFLSIHTRRSHSHPFVQVICEDGCAYEIFEEVTAVPVYFLTLRVQDTRNLATLESGEIEAIALFFLCS